MLVRHYEQLTLPVAGMVFGQKRFPIALLSGFINHISEHFGTRQEDLREEFEAISPLKPGLARRRDFRILLMIPLDWMHE